MLYKGTTFISRRLLCPLLHPANSSHLAMIYLNAGTSTDVSRFAGQYEHVFETTTAGITIQAPQVTHPRRLRDS